MPSYAQSGLAVGKLRGGRAGQGSAMRAKSQPSRSEPCGGRPAAQAANAACHSAPNEAASSGHARATSPARLRSRAVRVAVQPAASKPGGTGPPATRAAHERGLPFGERRRHVIAGYPAAAAIASSSARRSAAGG